VISIIIEKTKFSRNSGGNFEPFHPTDFIFILQSKTNIFFPFKGRTITVKSTYIIKCVRKTSLDFGTEQTRTSSNKVPRNQAAGSSIRVGAARRILTPQSNSPHRTHVSRTRNESTHSCAPSMHAGRIQEAAADPAYIKVLRSRALRSDATIHTLQELALQELLAEVFPFQHYSIAHLIVI
jgi:hypothetical protein